MFQACATVAISSLLISDQGPLSSTYFRSTLTTNASDSTFPFKTLKSRNKLIKDSVCCLDIITIQKDDRKISKILRILYEGCTNVFDHHQNYSKVCRRCLKISVEDPNMFRLQTTSLTQLINSSFDINSVLTWVELLFFTVGGILVC